MIELIALGIVAGLGLAAISISGKSSEYSSPPPDYVGMADALLAQLTLQTKGTLVDSQVAVDNLDASVWALKGYTLNKENNLWELWRK